jgi:hypothetical protein
MMVEGCYWGGAVMREQSEAGRQPCLEATASSLHLLDAGLPLLD